MPPGYTLLTDGDYIPPLVGPDGSVCLEGPLCFPPACDVSCGGFCNLRGECLPPEHSAACPSICPGRCDTQGRCYNGTGSPKAPNTSKGPAVATGVGELRGALSIDEDGAARYNLPLQMPPGRGGLEPNLAFAYSSRGGDGPLGLGWSLAGVPAIAVCEHSSSDEGFSSAVLAPALCLDGEPLRSLFAGAGNPSASLDNEPFYYRPRLDAGYVVQGTVSSWQYVDSGSGVRAGLAPGDTFVMYRDDGRVFTFGGSSEYLFRGGQDPLMGPSDVRKWLLAKVEDQYGNRLQFEYDKAYYHFTGASAYDPSKKTFLTDPSGSVTRKKLETEIILRRISYNFQGRTAHSEVTFHYNEDKLASLKEPAECDADGHCVLRPAVHIKYWRGGPLGSLLMLDRVEARTMGRLVRSYDLGQLTTSAGRVTLLEWLQECDYDYRGATCLAPLNLEYGEPNTGEAGDGTDDVNEMGDPLTTRTTKTLDELPWQYAREHTAVADVNGDGADDYLVLGDDGALWMSSGMNTMSFRKVADESDFPTFLYFHKTEGKNATYDLPFGMHATDWNKDGLADLIVWGVDQKQHDDGENVVSRCAGKTGRICGRNDRLGRLSARVPLGVWIYQAKLDGSTVSFSIKRVLAEADMPNEGLGLASAANLASAPGIHLSASIRDPGPTRNVRIAVLDYNQDGLSDILYCSNSDNDQGDNLGVLAIATGAHLGSRWVECTPPTDGSHLSVLHALDRVHEANRCGDPAA